MGVPKFFRWLSERYPKINQRYGSEPNPETKARYFPLSSSEEEGKEGDNNDSSSQQRQRHPDLPDPLSTCGLPPEIDRLYIDMNGIIHGCSHNNSDTDEDTNTITGSAANTAAAAAAADTTSTFNSGEGTHSTTTNSTTSSTKITEPEIFNNVCYYLDRIIGDIVQPNQLVYMAIDGVAPRAKLNQQRARRYRSGQEGQIEMNIYEAHAKAIMKEAEEEKVFNNKDTMTTDEESSSVFDIENGYSMAWGTDSSKKKNSSSDSSNKIDDDSNTLREVSPGRFKGKFESGITTTQQQQQQGVTATTTAAASNDDNDNEKGGEGIFHHNAITPGTEFFSRFTDHLEHFVKYKISTDPKWKDLTIIISGPNVPGEGEHKIMDFMRQQKYTSNKDYNPNLRHCIMGQDGDWMMLGLATHEPNLVLLRERVLFNMTKERLNLAAAKNPLDLYIHNSHFEFLHMGVLRDYLAYEFNTSNINPESKWDIERTIDDFVFMTFFVGNDFLPHMPALDIGDNAFEHLFLKYIECRKEWNKKSGGKKNHGPYLTHAGEIVSGKRLEQYLSAVGSHENSYYIRKKKGLTKENKRLRDAYLRSGEDPSTIPDDELIASKEQADRDAYRRMLEQQQQQSTAATTTTKHNNSNINNGNGGGEFIPVVSSELIDFNSDSESDSDEEEDKKLLREDDLSFISQMGTILQNSISGLGGTAGDNNNNSIDDKTRIDQLDIDDQDLKGRYYYDKFQMTPFDAEKHMALRKSYVEGLVWTLKYYYQGCVSWEWYYPYHYGPMLSDLVGLDEMLEEISFDDEKSVGKPLKPFEQLMGCMPPSQARILPKPYRWLMTDPKSPIIDFYPTSFTIDMNGKRWPWEAVTLLPFIDSKRLLDAVSHIDENQLTAEELQRNSYGEAIVLEYNDDQSEFVPAVGATEGFQSIEQNKTKIVPFESSSWNKKLDDVPILKPELTPGVHVPLPGFGCLRDAPVQRLARRRVGVNVFGSKSRYQTACLEMSNFVSSDEPPPSLESVAHEFIGKTVFVNYPYFLEALVIAVSNEEGTIRGGMDEPRPWTDDEVDSWQTLRLGTEKNLENGEGLTGTGGLIIRDDHRMTLSVRPVQGIEKTENGSSKKCFAKFSIEVPYISALWKPSRADNRFSELPHQLEPDAYEVAVPLHRAAISESGSLKKTKRLFPARSKHDSSIDKTGENLHKGPKRERKRSSAPPQPTENENIFSKDDLPPAVDSAASSEAIRNKLFPPRKSSQAVDKAGSLNGVLKTPFEVSDDNVLTFSSNKEDPQVMVENNDSINGSRKTLLPAKENAEESEHAVLTSSKEDPRAVENTGSIGGMRRTLLPPKKNYGVSNGVDLIGSTNNTEPHVVENAKKIGGMRKASRKSLPRRAQRNSRKKARSKSTRKSTRRKATSTSKTEPDKLEGGPEVLARALLPEKKDPQVTKNGGLIGGTRKTLLPPKKATISQRGFSSFAPDLNKYAALESSTVPKGGLSTFAPDLKRYFPHESSFSSTGGMNQANQGLLDRRNQVRMARAVMKTSSSPRGRIVAAGMVAAGFFFSSASGAAAGSCLSTTCRLPSLPIVHPWNAKASSVDFITNLRGGDMEEDDGIIPGSSSSVPPLEFAHGTTTISFVFQGGIIAAVDSRASLGSFVGSKTVEKVLPVNSHILGTMAGGAADCMFWIRKLKSEALLHELTESSRITVARASRLLSNALYQNRGLGLSVGTMIMGFDESGSSKIFYVDNTGVRIEGDQFAVGSGSTFALGILDTERRYDLSEEDAISLGIKAIRHATFRDAYSGGFINVFLITKDGWKKVFTEDLAR